MHYIKYLPLVFSIIVGISSSPLLTVTAQARPHRGIVVRLSNEDDFYYDRLYVKPGTQEKGSFTLQHEYPAEDKPATLYLYAADFLEKEDGTGVEEPTDGLFYNNEYSVAQYIKLDKSEVTLPQYGAEARVNFTIDIPADFTPGLRFARILASNVKPEVRNIQDLINSDTSVGTSLMGTGIASRVVITTLLLSIGDKSDFNTEAEVTNAYLTDFDNNPGLLGFIFDVAPVHSVIELKNTGNQQFLAGGNVTWHDGDPTKPMLFDKFNEQRYRILPGSRRKFTNTWSGGVMLAKGVGKDQVEYVWQLDKLDFAWGRHLVDTKVTYTNTKGELQVIAYRMEFWFLPWKAILTIAVVIIAILTFKYFSRENKSKKGRK